MCRPNHYAVKRDSMLTTIQGKGDGVVNRFFMKLFRTNNTETVKKLPVLF